MNWECLTVHRKQTLFLSEYMDVNSLSVGLKMIKNDSKKPEYDYRVEEIDEE